MIIKPKLIYFNVFIFLFLYVFVNPSAKKSQQENNQPTVKIINPKNNGTFDFDTPVNYEISVADKEDGNSKYDEINAKEVLLEVRYLSDKSKVQGILAKGVQPDAPGLAVMRVSNCFNCHNFNSKAIGPSFFEISKRYPASSANTDSLVKRIKAGSSGLWGKEKMPSHTELSAAEIRSTVQWMLKNSTNPGVNYYVGTIGSFRIAKSAGQKKNGAYILTASYIDHGLKETPGKQRLKGQDIIVISCR